MTGWDPALYARYEAYRERPALDLMAQIPADLQPREVWDLGCGLGQHAVSLARRYPSAQVFGLDSSAEMLSEARTRSDAVAWVQSAVEDWRPERPVDLIFSNAALHWAEAHDRLFPRLAEALAPGGVLAVQMPVTLGIEWREAVAEIAAQGPWAERLRGVTGVPGAAGPEAYYDWLTPLCRDVDVWTTSYLHRLQGEGSVVEWIAGAGLRPYANALEGEDREAFMTAVAARMDALFPRRADGTTLFPFPRLFIVARR